MRSDRPRMHWSAWVCVAAALWCFAVVCWHVTAIAAGQPLQSVLWALPLNAVCVLLNVRSIRREARRAAASADVRAGARMRG